MEIEDAERRVRDLSARLRELSSELAAVADESEGVIRGPPREDLLALARRMKTMSERLQQIPARF
jgi:hypothetical protein